MKKIVNFLFCVLFSILAVSPSSVSASLSPFGMNASTDPTQGTAAAADIFQDVTLETFEEGNASDMVAPAWLRSFAKTRAM